jgi:hypothetical protein
MQPEQSVRQSKFVGHGVSAEGVLHGPKFIPSCGIYRKKSCKAECTGLLRNLKVNLNFGMIIVTNESCGLSNVTDTENFATFEGVWSHHDISGDFGTVSCPDHSERWHIRIAKRIHFEMSMSGPHIFSQLFL